jgi:hypothetical protein
VKVGLSSEGGRCVKLGVLRAGYRGKGFSTGERERSGRLENIASDQVCFGSQRERLLVVCKRKLEGKVKIDSKGCKVMEVSTGMHLAEWGLVAGFCECGSE